jgi:heme exporter protein C
MIRPLEIAAIGTIVTAAVVGLFVVPADVVQGTVQRIMYVHVPSAWLAYIAFVGTLVGSIGYLATRRLRWDRLAGSSAEIGVVFTGLALATGSIWGRPVWGVWWTWDARLVLTAVMFFVYLGYLALRRAIDDPVRRAGRSAVFGILAVAQIPLVHFSVVWWRTLHQPPTVIRPDGPQIDPPLLFALLMAVVAFTVAYAALLRRRVELARLEDRLAELAADDEAVAGAAVAAPQTGGSR